MIPAFFISHGSPMTALEPSAARDFLSGFGAGVEARWGRPKAIVVASAHWETAVPTVNAVQTNDTIHDFHGFPPPLYALRYPAPGSPELAAEIVRLLAAAGLETAVDHQRGLDHGAWVPLMLAWPAADIPVVQLSLQPHHRPTHHLRLGAALQPLRAQGVLVLGSGSFTHDLRRFRGQDIDARESPDVTAFADWMDQALREGRARDLSAYRQQAPFATAQHPTEEHLLPLFVALGAAGETPTTEKLHSSSSYGILRMDAYAFA